jgi:hypothetical protein
MCSCHIFTHTIFPDPTPPPPRPVKFHYSTLRDVTKENVSNPLFINDYDNYADGGDDYITVSCILICTECPLNNHKK